MYIHIYIYILVIIFIFIHTILIQVYRLYFNSKCLSKNNYLKLIYIYIYIEIYTY